MASSVRIVEILLDWTQCLFREHTVRLEVHLRCLSRHRLYRRRTRRYPLIKRQTN